MLSPILIAPLLSRLSTLKLYSKTIWQINIMRKNKKEIKHHKNTSADRSGARPCTQQLTWHVRCFVTRNISLEHVWKKVGTYKKTLSVRNRLSKANFSDVLCSTFNTSSYRTDSLAVTPTSRGASCSSQNSQCVRVHTLNPSQWSSCTAKSLYSTTQCLPAPC